MVLRRTSILKEAILSHIFMTFSTMEPHNLCLQLIIQVKFVKFVITKVTLHWIAFNMGVRFAIELVMLLLHALIGIRLLQDYQDIFLRVSLHLCLLKWLLGNMVKLLCGIHLVLLKACFHSLKVHNFNVLPSHRCIHLLCLSQILILICKHELVHHPQFLNRISGFLTLEQPTIWPQTY